MRGNILQGLAVFLILGMALLADGLMDALGPGCYILVNTPLLLLAGFLIWLSTRPPKRKRRPRGGTPRSGKKPSRKG